MSERRVFGDAVARASSSDCMMRRHLRHGRCARRASPRRAFPADRRQIGMTPQIPPEDSFIVAQYLTRLPYHELWSGGRPLLTQGYAANAMRIVNLTGEFSARITHPHEALNFHIPRAALDELADDAGRPRLAHLACTPGIVDPVLVHLTAALLPAFERPEQAKPVVRGLRHAGGLQLSRRQVWRWRTAGPGQTRRPDDSAIAPRQGDIGREQLRAYPARRRRAGMRAVAPILHQGFQGDYRARPAPLAAAASDRPCKANPERDLAADRRHRARLRVRRPEPSDAGVRPYRRRQPGAMAARPAAAVTAAGT